ncbi:MAG: hypothetical protein JKX85_08815 [Phycisphaeraceae bacterium]|nr:hypothetical protein [Phycisphaeraceae bacterium]
MNTMKHILITQQPARRKRRGFTIVELMLATIGVSLIALGISSMLSVVAYGTTSSRDLRSLVVKQKTTSARLDAAIRGSKLVLESGADYMVLWVHDDNDDSKPSLSEIRRVELDLANEHILSYKAQLDGLSLEMLAAVDGSFEFDSDFDALTESFKNPQYFVDIAQTLSLTLALDDANLFPPEIWATSVSGLLLALDVAPSQQARLVNYQVTFDIGTLSDTTIGTASLRNE